MSDLSLHCSPSADEEKGPPEVDAPTMSFVARLGASATLIRAFDCSEAPSPSDPGRTVETAARPASTISGRGARPSSACALPLSMRLGSAWPAPDGRPGVVSMSAGLAVARDSVSRYPSQSARVSEAPLSALGEVQAKRSWGPGDASRPPARPHFKSLP